MAFAKLKKPKGLQPLLDDDAMLTRLREAAGSSKDVAVMKAGALVVRKFYEGRRDKGTLVNHPQRLTYVINLEDETVKHECCGATWKAGRWMTSFIPDNYRPGMALLIRFCPVCGALAKPEDAKNAESHHLAMMLERERVPAPMAVVKDDNAE